MTPDQRRNEIALLQTSRFERDMRAKYGPDIDAHMTAGERLDYADIAGRVNWKLACEDYQRRRANG